MKCVSKPQIKMYSSQRNVFEFKDIVLDWEISSILQHDGDFNCLERAATFSDSSAYFNGLKPLILAESWATLKEDLIRYKKGEIKGSELQVRKLQTRRSGPQTITMRGSIRKFDPKLEMVEFIQGRVLRTIENPRSSNNERVSISKNNNLRFAKKCFAR